MKRIFFLIVLVAATLQINAQRLRGNYNAVDYYAQDSSTFYLGIEPGTRLVYVDFTDFDANDAYIKIGAAGNDAKGWAAISWTSGATTADSVILNVTTATSKDKNAFTGTRTSTAREYFWFSDGVPSSYIAIHVRWVSVTSGRLKVYF